MVEKNSEKGFLNKLKKQQIKEKYEFWDWNLKYCVKNPVNYEVWSSERNGEKFRKEELHFFIQSVKNGGV